MKKLITVALLLGSLPMTVKADPLLTGDTKLACEALLCLSTSSRPTECNESIRKYFSIKHKKWHKTVQARKNFLKLCPTSNEPGMPSLVNTLAEGAGNCDVDFLNRNNTKRVIKHECIINELGEQSCNDQVIRVINKNLPNYCQVYNDHEYTDLNLKYVGNPNEGGFWTNGFEYQGKLAEYNAKQAKMKAQDDATGLNAIVRYRNKSGQYMESPKRTVQYFEYNRKYFGFRK